MFKRAFCFVAVIILAGLLSPEARLGADPSRKPQGPPRFHAWGGIESFTGEGSAFFHTWSRENTRWVQAKAENVETADIRFQLKRVAGSAIGDTSATWEVVGCTARGAMQSSSSRQALFDRGDTSESATFEGLT